VSWIASRRALRRAGVLGINRRNHEYTLRWNPRRLYPRVDDKLLTKRLCAAAGIPIPKLLAVAAHHFELRRLPAQLAGETSFVLKPARGAMGNGVLVIVDRDGDRLVRPGGARMTLSDLEYHAASTISGLYSLGGQPDVAMVEERLEVHPELAEIAEHGVPDVRVIVFRGVPVMAMTRLPTRRSGGRANLHQGAVGVGIDLARGRTVHAMLRGASVTRHPDTGRPLLDRPVPAFARILEIAVRACDESGLGYVGADLVVDPRRGPVVLELNARPGLAVQVANRAGLLPRLRAVERAHGPGLPVEDRVALGCQLARGADLEARP
jgi:alpha-L-glutamate ligase-like protein